MMILQILKAHGLDFDCFKVKHMFKVKRMTYVKTYVTNASGKGLLPHSNLALGLEY